MNGHICGNARTKRRKWQDLNNQHQLANEGLLIRPLRNVRSSSHAAATRRETRITSLLSMFSYGVIAGVSRCERQKILRAPNS